MLSKNKIADLLKRIGYKEPKFYYRTKTIFNEKLTTIYLIFVQKYVVLARTDPRNVQRESLEFVEKIPFYELAFFKEDNMYLVMKWKQKHLLIGFKEENVLNKFCEKILSLEISLGKNSKKRVLGNDDGESVSYKLDNESIDHISTDTKYEVLSFKSENKKERNNSENASFTSSYKSFSTKNSKFSNEKSDNQKSSRNLSNEKSCRSENTKKSSKYSNEKSLRKPDNSHSQSIQASFEDKNGEELYSSKLDDDLKKRSQKFDESEPPNKNYFEKYRKKRSQQTFQRIDPELVKEMSNRRVKVHIEFGSLNFFVLTNSTFQALCHAIILRLCEHFDKSSKKSSSYDIELLEHFNMFVRFNNKLFRIDSESDFVAALYGTELNLDIVISNR